MNTDSPAVRIQNFGRLVRYLNLSTNPDVPEIGSYLRHRVQAVSVDESGIL